MNEAKWQAQDDAHTLARAEEIKADKNRLQAAKKEAGAMLNEQRQRTNSLAKVAGKEAAGALKGKGTISVGGLVVPRY